MKRILFAFCLLLPSLAVAQKWVSPNFDNHHLDYRDLGYPGVSEIPPDDSRISALLTGQDGYVYGATSGKQSYLFLYDRQINKVRPLGQIPDCQGVHHALVQDRDGALYFGTGLNLLDEVPLTKDFPGGNRQIENQLWKDIQAYHAGFEGGRILKFNPTEQAENVFLPDDAAVVEDLGLIEPNNSIYSLAYDRVGHRLYGLTYPDTIFFSVDLSNGTIKRHGPLLTRKIYSGPERSWRTVSRALLCLEDGDVITSGEDGWIMRFDARTETFAQTDLRIPGEYWESWNYSGYPVVEQLIKDAQGNIWGTTSDGFLFVLNLEQNQIRDLGKPRVSRRVRAMTLAPNGELYLICGELGEPGKLISYNTRQRDGFKNWSYLSVDRSPYYAKRGYQFEAMTVGVDGTIFIGESDRRGKLFLFTAGARIFPGGLNPKNPR